ncbi:hypothetical protein [Rhizobium laguerreae]|uniref:hypothetical protein n=1 Tax=Rhizobium laguerreae TaxID=1076926 RepID=UPI001C9005CF|nr:hypothetical protein [Rhizobium laguerreae]MBY3344887.1 hypothetical protein [Rhizobium laguerreae]MBY3351921.1 hypothetical protein [Rhizobium laguerreae]MBY3372594.1 hypothetical protein [Rhizobium laguerreae]MBY3427761.1 hypothetical protein [Rhizobium laguerreae]MBY3436771.1 hypothetical protein [Rhizobium laguerreae]
MSEDQKPPHIRLAVENDQRELNRRTAEIDLRWPLKTLAANFIRIVRGAGSPAELGRQCAEVVQAYRDYHAALGEWPSSYLISETLSLRHRENHATSDRAWEWEEAMRQMVAGGLQVAASQLLKQNTQQRAGESEMFEGLRVIEKQRSENAAARMQKPKPKPRTPGKRRPKPDDSTDRGS